MSGHEYDSQSNLSDCLAPHLAVSATSSFPCLHLTPHYCQTYNNNSPVNQPHLSSLPKPFSAVPKRQDLLACQRTRSLPYENAKDCRVDPDCDFLDKNTSCIRLDSSCPDKSENDVPVSDSEFNSLRRHSTVSGKHHVEPPFLSLPFTFTDTQAVEVTVNTNISPASTPTSSPDRIVESAQYLSVNSPPIISSRSSRYHVSDQQAFHKPLSSTTLSPHVPCYRMNSAPEAASTKQSSEPFKRKSVRRHKSKNELSDLQIEMLPFKIEDPVKKEESCEPSPRKNVNSRNMSLTSVELCRNTQSIMSRMSPFKSKVSADVELGLKPPADDSPKSLLSVRPKFPFNLESPRRDTL